MRSEPAQYEQIGMNCLYGSPILMSGFHWHNEVEINYVERGEVTYLFGGQRVVIPAQRIAVFWATIPHRLLHAREKTAFAWLTMPLAWFLQWQLPENLTIPILHNEVVIAPEDDAALDRIVFSRWHQDLQSGKAALQRVVILEVEARLRRLSLAIEEAPGETAAVSKQRVSAFGKDLVSVERLARVVAERYTEPLLIPDIAREAGLHPNYAMALFRSRCGISLSNYLNHHRISHAQRLLVTTDAKIIDIAMASGFGSVSQFYVHFRRACGQSPKEYRASLRLKLVE